MDKDRIAGGVKKVAGKIKEQAGKALGDTQTETEGKPTKPKVGSGRGRPSRMPSARSPAR
jgi:uncharacterized protein YjbJ (UPF0337 family)